MVLNKMDITNTLHRVDKQIDCMIRNLRAVWNPVNDGSDQWRRTDTGLREALMENKPMSDDLDIELDTQKADFTNGGNAFSDLYYFNLYKNHNQGHLRIIKPKLKIHIDKEWRSMYVENSTGHRFEAVIDDKWKNDIKEFVIFHQEQETNTRVDLIKYVPDNGELSLQFYAGGNTRIISFAGDGYDPIVFLYITFKKKP